MPADDIVPLTMPPVEGMGLSVDLQRRQLICDGEILEPINHVYEFYGATEEAERIRISLGWSGHTPVVFINGEKHHLLPPLSFGQNLAVALPFILLLPICVFQGSQLRLFLFILLSVGSTSLNIKIFRSKRSTAARYILSIFVTLGCLVIYFAGNYIFHIF